MLRVGIMIGFVALAGCGGGAVQQSAEDVARGAAKTVVNTAVQSQFPALNASMVTDCIIDNASLDEVLLISKDAVTASPTAQTIAMVSDIANRPGTIQCFADKGKALLAK